MGLLNRIPTTARENAAIKKLASDGFDLVESLNKQILLHPYWEIVPIAPPHEKWQAFPDSYYVFPQYSPRVYHKMYYQLRRNGHDLSLRIKQFWNATAEKHAKGRYGTLIWTEPFNNSDSVLCRDVKCFACEYTLPKGSNLYVTEYHKWVISERENMHGLGSYPQHLDCEAQHENERET